MILGISGKSLGNLKNQGKLWEISWQIIALRENYQASVQLVDTIIFCGS